MRTTFFAVLLGLLAVAACAETSFVDVATSQPFHRQVVPVDAFHGWSMQPHMLLQVREESKGGPLDGSEPEFVAWQEQLVHDTYDFSDAADKTMERGYGLEGELDDDELAAAVLKLRADVENTKVKCPALAAEALDTLHNVGYASSVLVGAYGDLFKRVIFKRCHSAVVDMALSRWEDAEGWYRVRLARVWRDEHNSLAPETLMRFGNRILQATIWLARSDEWTEAWRTTMDVTMDSFRDVYTRYPGFHAMMMHALARNTLKHLQADRYAGDQGGPRLEYSCRTMPNVALVDAMTQVVAADKHYAAWRVAADCYADAPELVALVERSGGVYTRKVLAQLRALAAKPLPVKAYEGSFHLNLEYDIMPAFTAVRALGNFNHIEAREELLAVLVKPGEGPTAWLRQLGAVDGLRRLRDPSTLRIMIDMLRNAKMLPARDEHGLKFEQQDVKVYELLRAAIREVATSSFSHGVSRADAWDTLYEFSAEVNAEGNPPEVTKYLDGVLSTLAGAMAKLESAGNGPAPSSGAVQVDASALITLHDAGKWGALAAKLEKGGARIALGLLFEHLTRKDAMQPFVTELLSRSKFDAVVDAFALEAAKKYHFAADIAADVQVFSKAATAMLRLAPDHVAAFVTRNVARVGGKGCGHNQAQCQAPVGPAVVDIVAELNDGSGVYALLASVHTASVAVQTHTKQVLAKMSDKAVVEAQAKKLLDSTAKDAEKVWRSPHAAKPDELEAPQRHFVALQVLTVLASGQPGAAPAWFAPLVASLKHELTLRSEALASAWSVMVSHEEVRAKELNKLYQLRGMAQEDDDLLSASSAQRLTKDIDMLETLLHKIRNKYERKASQLTAMLMNREVGYLLLALPAAELSKVLDAATKHLQGTDAGRSFAHFVVAAARDPKELLWNRVFNGHAHLMEGAFAVLENMAGEFVVLGKDKYMTAIMDALGMHKTDEEHVEHAHKDHDSEEHGEEHGGEHGGEHGEEHGGEHGEHHAEGAFAEFEEFLLMNKVGIDGLAMSGVEHTHLVHLAHTYSGANKFVHKTLHTMPHATYPRVLAVFTAFNLYLGVKEVMHHPSVRNVLATSRDAIHVIEAIEAASHKSKLMTRAGEFMHKSKFLERTLLKSGRFAKAGTFLKGSAKVAGKLVGPLTVVVGVMDLHKSTEKRDMGGIFFDAVTVTGGIVMTAGVVFSGTVVGAVAGVPLTLIGGVMSGVGMVGKWLWGDSQQETFCKELGYC